MFLKHTVMWPDQHAVVWEQENGDHWHLLP